MFHQEKVFPQSKKLGTCICIGGYCTSVCAHGSQSDSVLWHKAR